MNQSIFSGTRSGTAFVSDPRYSSPRGHVVMITRRVGDAILRLLLVVWLQLPFFCFGPWD